MIHIELYGVPRLRAGMARLTVEGGDASPRRSTPWPVPARRCRNR